LLSRLIDQLLSKPTIKKRLYYTWAADPRLKGYLMTLMA